MKKPDRDTIVANRQARREYFIEDTFDAGLVLEGWEVRSLREGRAQLRESYAVINDGEAWLLGAHIAPLPSASTHIEPIPTRRRKLLLHAREIRHLTGAVERRGYTMVPLRLYWSRSHVKLQLGTARGKRQHDKRASERERDWNREKSRILKSAT